MGWIVPNLQYSMQIYKDELESLIKPGTHWLDLGCGRRTLPVYFQEVEKHLIESCEIVVGIDGDLPSLLENSSLSCKVKGDVSKLPFRDNSFDIVSANMVLEHLEDPVSSFKELRRVLRPNGLILVHTPNILSFWPLVAILTPECIKRPLVGYLEGRKEDSIFKAYYRANTAKKIRKLSSIAGLKVRKLRMIVSIPVFRNFKILLIPELIITRVLMLKPFAMFRSNIIAILELELISKGVEIDKKIV